MGKSKRQSNHLLPNRTFTNNEVEVKREIEMRPDGKSVLAVSLDLSSAPVPDRKYLADVASIISTSHSIKLLFAQNKLNGDLRTLLVVDISSEVAQKYIKAVDEMPGTNFQQIAALNKQPIPELSIFTDEPEQTIAFKANALSGAVSGLDACLDFYYISPVAMRNFMQTDKIDIDAVVRVDMHVNLFVSLINELRKIASNYPVVEEFKND